MTTFQERFTQCVELFRNARDKTGSPLSMLGFAADAWGERANHTFQATDSAADLRSVSKVVTALVLGRLISQKVKLADSVVELESRVEPLLRHHMNEAARLQWKDVRILDLFNNTIGHEEGFLFRKDLGDLPESRYLSYIFSVPLLYPPGTHFSYSNVGPFLFSVIVQDWLKQSLHELARTTVLDSLGIESQWRNFGDYVAGSTGLCMANESLIKLATLFRNKGNFENQRIVPKFWVEEMSLPRTLTPHMFDASRVFPKYAYGIGLWICKNGSYYCDGTNGQYLIVIPRDGVAISTTGEQPDMKPITKCMEPFVLG